MKKILVLCLALFLSFDVPFAYGAKKAKGEEPENLISVDFQNMNLYTVLNVLSIKTGMKLVTDTSLYKKEIMLSLKDVTPREALGVLMDTYDLYYVQQGDSDIYVIKSKSDPSHITVSKVIFCNYASASEISGILSTRLSKGGKLAVDSRTNSIVVTDLADSIAKMEDLLKSLDIPTQQVLLESKIIEVNLGDEFNIGTTWSNISKNKMISGTSSIIFDTNTIGEVSNNFGRASISILEGDWSLTGTFGAGIVDRSAKVLSNPKILVLNNQEASIDIVEEIPYMESQTTTTGSDTTTVSTSFKEAGIKLKVKPQINRDGSIILSVSPEQSYDTGRSAYSDNVPIINTSKSTTTLMLRSGE
ncbi:MAG: hypothetical protein II816_05780, partial [Elusimicrobia bacterium]|nr:hypothetical protein [Elusimicrobiota bacterium]